MKIRYFLELHFVSLLIVIFSLFSISAIANTQPGKATQFSEKIKNLEKSSNGRIGIYAIDTNNNQILAYRADERFPLQSTIKLLGAAAILKQSDSDKNLLQEKIQYTKADLIAWHPITGNYVNSGMTLAALAEAAISYSDNPAMNLIMKKLGGPAGLTAFAYSIDNKTFNVAHYEGNLNSNPNDDHDTATPKDMAISLQKLTLGDILTNPKRVQLITWLRNNTTGNKRMRAGTPIGWIVADKTGSGDYGVANDIGIMWLPFSKPVVLAIYTVQSKQDAKMREDIVAAATSVVLNTFAKN